MFDIRMASRSNRGDRETNEDALRIGSAGVTHYAVVSDGAGGHARGAEASRRAADCVQAALRSAAAAFAADRMHAAVLRAHAELQREQHGAQGRERMHATVVALWLDAQRGRALWSHVGDSRLYRLRYGELYLLTQDDSVVQGLLDGGALTPEQARTHPLKNQLLAALGMQGELCPHTAPEAVGIEDGDAYLLCTDGWWGELDEHDIGRTLSSAHSPQAWLDAMHEHIVRRRAEGQDNFSAVAAWVIDPIQCTLPMVDSEVTIAAPLSGL